MKAVHESRNLVIQYDEDPRTYRVLVRFGTEAIDGQAPGACPRCHQHTHLALWELEGPGSNANTLWLTCGNEPICMLDGKPLRWAVKVTFDRDWAEG